MAESCQLLYSRYKGDSNANMDQTKAPRNLWLQYIALVVYIMSQLAMEPLKHCIPITMASGVTPDILLACNSIGMKQCYTIHLIEDIPM